MGVIFNKNVTFRSHISAVCSSCFYHVRHLQHVCRYLDLDSTKLLAPALVPSRLNYCNTLLYGITDSGLTKLQLIQNQLACLVTKSPPFTCSVPLLPSLHWLPVRLRIMFKNDLLTYKTLREKQPVYLHSMPSASLLFCSLRSNKDNGVSVPRVKTNQHRCKSFALLCSVSLEQPPAVCPFSYFSCYLQETFEDTSL